MLINQLPFHGFSVECVKRSHFVLNDPASVFRLLIESVERSRFGLDGSNHWFKVYFMARSQSTGSNWTLINKDYTTTN
jgi:hypothetical protein